MKLNREMFEESLPAVVEDVQELLRSADLDFCLVVAYPAPDNPEEEGYFFCSGENLKHGISPEDFLQVLQRWVEDEEIDDCTEI